MRSAVLSGYPGLARELGLEPAQLLESAGLSGLSLDDPELRIPAKRFAQLLELSAREAGIDDFGLRLAQRHGLATLGPIAMLAREQSTLRDALACLLRYISAHNEAVVVRIDEAGSTATCVIDLEYGEPVLCRQGIEYAVAGGLTITRTLLGTLWRPTLVLFRHEAPRRLARHARLLGAPFRFGAEVNGFVFPRRDLGRKVPAANAEFARQAERYLRLIVHPTSPSELKDRVQRAIEALLPSGLCTAARVARQLGVDRRTVHRQLLRAGTSYALLLHEFRGQTVERYLSHGERRLGEISRMLGFSSLSAFSRWFKASYQCSPSSWRLKQ